MDTAAREAPVVAPRPAAPHGRRRDLLGPGLIVASVLIAMRGFALGRLSTQHPDLLTFWLPRSCLLGRALRDGRLPVWNPHELAGTPFLADPQSGWMSLLGMTLPAILGCGAGLVAIVILQPIMAGLGMRWFLRREGLGRPAATAGGLGLAMLVAQSKIAISMPFAGSIAWTPLLLVATAGFSERTGRGRLGWLALAAVAWGQVATAHLSHGLVIATALAIAVLLSRFVPAVRRGASTTPHAALLAGGFLLALPLLNLAILIPHAALLARSSLAEGYTALGEIARASGIGSRPLPTDGVWSAWPLALAATPGGYLGAALLLAAPGAIRIPRHRALAIAIAAAMGLVYLLTLDLLVGAAWFRRLVLAIPYGDVYLHNPGRLRHLWYLGAPILGAIGLEGFATRPPRGRAAAAWLLAPIAVFLVWPLAAGALPERLGVFAIAAAVTIAAGAIVLRRRPGALASVLLGVLAIDLLAGALWASSWNGGTVILGLEGRRPVLVPAPLRWPDADLAEVLRPGPLARRIAADPQGSRYLAWVPPAAYFMKGYLFSQRPEDRPALLLGRSILFGLHDALGYSPVQLPRYWSYLRATNDLPLFYNAAAIQVPTRQDADLLGVGWLIAPRGLALPDGLRGAVVEREGGFALVRLDDPAPRASVVGRWTSVGDLPAALATVLAPGFDGRSRATLEGAGEPVVDEGAGPTAPAGTATYREATPEHVEIGVRATRRALLVVRTAWDRGWSATIDGEPATVAIADGFLQGIVVPAGDHQVVLRYRDPTIGAGLAGSLLAWTTFAVLALAARVRRRAA